MSDLRRWAAIGTGVGIEAGDRDLRVTMARVRPGGVRVLGAAVIARFRERPAAEWGAVYHDFLKRLGGAHLSATVLLPRRELIVRQLTLPGVAERDLAAAIQLQIDSLHPYGEDEAAWAWARVGRSGAVLIAIIRRATLDRYIELFAEAGIAVAAFTVSAAAIYSALRLLRAPAAQLLAFYNADGALDVYGESEARPVFSAAFDVAPEKAVALAAAELRLPADVAASELTALLPAPKAAPPDYDLSASVLAYAAALAGACPRLALPVNLLPAEHRTSSSRAMFAPTAALALLLLACLAALAAIHPIEDSKYLAALSREIARIEPLALRAGSLDRSIDRARARARLLDAFRGQTKADLDSLLELNQILKPPAFLAALELDANSVTLSGQAEQAAPLLKIVDGSPLFQRSEFTVPISRAGKNEVFRVRAEREGRPR